MRRSGVRLPITPLASLGSKDSQGPESAKKCDSGLFCALFGYQSVSRSLFASHISRATFEATLPFCEMGPKSCPSLPRKSLSNKGLRLCAAKLFKNAIFPSKWGLQSCLYPGKPMAEETKCLVSLLPRPPTSSLVTERTSTKTNTQNKRGRVC